MSLRKITTAFSGGEVTPEFWGQLGDAKFQTGLAACRNFTVLPHGPVANRPGFAYVNTVKTPAKKTRLIPFTYSTTQTMVIELGHEYVRFHTQGATLLDAGVPYEVATPYQDEDIFDIHFVQSADVLTLVHPKYPPKELRRLGAVSWTLVDVSFIPSLTKPAAPTVTPSGTGTTTYTYVVTSVGPTGLEESEASPPTSTTNNLLVTGQYNTITWTGTGAPRYSVYKQDNGLYGFIGQTDTTTFKDDNIAADLSQTPPIINDPFAAADTYPGAVSYFEQRRCFAGSINEPQNIRMTRSGTESNLSYSIPSRDDDSINVRVAAREANTIRHIVPMANLVLLTAAAEWRVTSINSDAITPTSISVKPQSYVGANNVQPVIVNNNVIYAASRGGHLRELVFDNAAGGYKTGDLSLRAPHLFDGYDVVDMAHSKAPTPLVWAVSSSGSLLGLTYVPEQMVGAMHRHDTQGVFESCCVVAEGAEDVLYVVVKRTINGADTRYVERMQSRQFTSLSDAFFVDAGATYNGAPTATITGLTWLEGETVSILGDGAVFPQQTVVGGSITIDQPCSKIHVGLPITAEVQTLPLAAQIDAAYAQGRVKNVNKAWLRVYRSSGVSAGPSPDRLVNFKQRTAEPFGTPPVLRTDELEILLPPAWDDGGQVYVRQADPLPLTLTSLTLEVEFGG